MLYLSKVINILKHEKVIKNHEGIKIKLNIFINLFKLIQ